jgi:hypothetical protein
MKKLVPVILMLLFPVASTAQEVVRIFPGAASAPGLDGAFFVTDVRLYNPDQDDAITVHLSFLDRDTDNSGAIEIPVEIPPRLGVAFNDVLASLFGLVDVAGAIRMRSDAPFFATSRTFNLGGEAGTFGSYIPGLLEDDALLNGILLQVVNDPADSGFRTNVGFAVPGLTAVTVTVRVFDAATGALIGERDLDLPPRTFSQINDVFKFVGARTRLTVNATVEFAADGPVLAYATVIDNTSNDPIFVIPFADEGTIIADNTAPNGSITSPVGDRTITEGESVQFSGQASDPDGDDVTVLWDFGDGITSTQLVPGSHTYTDAGTFTVTLTVTDEHGLADPTPPTRTITVEAPMGADATFTRVQDEIFTPSCALSGCHSAGSAAQGLVLAQGAAWGNIVSQPSTEQPQLDLIEPGDSENSYLWRKVNGGPSISGLRMPRGGSPLSQELLTLLEDWIDAGAQDD